MSVGAYASTVSAIDPNTGQVIELPIDQAGAYIMQDGSGVLTGAQLQANIQGGKSLLKPELAQHLSQHAGYKSSVGRGGFTLAASDPRWSNVNAPRSARNITSRKPLTGTSHMQPATLGMSQSAALAPTASGLLSLGTRYTPSSASAFGTNSVPTGATGTIVTPAGAGLVSATVGGLASDRDPNYRLAAAIAGTGGRGRPRGRRPLRGQFPVVPIDMVRQLGIEQQVILQPAAPVAMRNKAVLCRPLSMSRKTQASTVQYEGVGAENSLTTQTEDLDEFPALQQREKDVKSKGSSTFHVDDGEEEEMPVDTEEQSTTRRKTLDAETSTVNLGNLVDNTSQTEVMDEELPSDTPRLIPIPIPVPIYVPVPVCLYARPVPYALPFPLPCLFPLPMDLSSTKTLDKEPSEHEQAPAALDKTPSTSPYSEPEVDSEAELPQASEESDSLVIAAEPAAVETQIESSVEVPVPVGHSLKRRSPSPEQASVPVSTPSGIPLEAPAEIGSGVTETHITLSHIEPTVSHAISTTHESLAPPAKRPRQTLVVSDANYHLKFSYGINAWRHWVQHKLASVGGVNSALAHQQFPYLHTELVNMSEEDLNLALSQFVREVRKPNNECYVADSIFYLCLGIQEYLNENGCNINLFGGPTFADFSEALDNILANFQPRISPEGLLICRIEEEHLWEARQLGDQSPEVLLFTMLYFNTKHFGLRLGAAHRQLTLAHFHLTEEESPNTAVLCQFPDSVFGGSADGTTTLRVEMNLDYPERCPVALFKTYLSKCPPNTRVSAEAFYLVPVYPPDGSPIWYSTTPMDPAELQVILNRIKMVKEIQEAFMNGQPDGGF